MECLQIDLNNICRTCKCESPEMKSLYSRDSDSGKENPRLDEMLMACASIQVSSEDGLPKSICRLCFVQLKKAYCFKEQCERTDNFLRDYVKNLKKEIIKEETAINDYLLDEINTALSNACEENKLEGNIIKDDPELGDIRDKDADFVQVIDNNLTIYECRTCSKVFLTLESLTAHKRIHTGRTYKCKQCNKSYTRLNHLHRHEMSHGKRKIHVCKICNKTLTRFEHLKRHLITHLKEKPFGCPTCNRGFNRAEHLQNHLRCCKGERVHICDICNKGFNREDSLEVHRRVHENKTPVLPTLENLDNIQEHYMEIDCGGGGGDDDDDDNDNNDEDVGADNDVSFSDDHSEDETIEPEVQVSENNDQEKIAAIAQIANEIYAEEDPSEILMEKAKIEEEMYMEQTKEDDENRSSMDGDANGPEIDNGNNYQSDNSVHSEYLPTTRQQTSSKMKRGRGRPRKHPIGYKQTEGRRRGRPPLKSKIKTEESETGPFPCPECKENFSKMSSLERHAEHHKGLKIYECETCKKKFSRSNSLKRHKLSHNDVKTFLCVTCQKWFARRDHLQKHMKTHLNGNNGDADTAITTDKHKCDLCGTVFSRAENLAKHKAYMHNVGEKVAIAEKKYKCNYCQKGFTTEKYRDSHMKAHFGDKKYQCQTCDKSFISKSHLTEHMKFHNDSSKKFLCSECGQRFIRNDYLTIHMRRHRGEKPFKCKFCGKGFPRTTDLTVHERYHTGEKTHLCVVCGRGFGRAYNLTVHMRTHTGEKPYRCTYCDAAFAQGNDLKAHVRRHTGERFQCELCPETFLMGYLLTQHKRVVHGLNVVSNIRRLQPVSKFNSDDPPPITIPLPTPVVVPRVIVSSATATTMTDPLQVQQMEVLELKEELK